MKIVVKRYFSWKRTVFPFWREFWASFTILRTLTLTNAIWPKRVPHDLKRALCTSFMKSALFSLLERISGQCDDFENFDAHKCDLAKTCCAWPKKSVLYNFHQKRTVFPFGENLRPVWRFWELSRSKMRFGQNVLRMTWKERFVQFS